MIPLPLDEVAALCPGELRARAGAEAIGGVQIDSRRIAEGDLFVAVGRGAAFRGHALARGAAATLVPEDAFAALAALAGAVRSRCGAQVVGITGSVGKTSTRDILAGLAAPHARTIAAEANYNNELGVPLTLCRLEPDTEVCVLELGMRGLGQIAWLCSFARPDVGVITNVGPVHLELVGTLERVAEAKAELLRSARAAVVPGDPLLDPLVPGEIELRRFAPEDVRSFADGHAVLRLGEETVELDLAFTARYQASNALAALHAYDLLGLPLARAQAGATEIVLTGLRGEELPLPGGGVLINDCYNASPVSMHAALAHLAERAGSRRRVAVLGEMAELGAGGPAYHRQVGEAAAAHGVQALLAVGPLARGYLGGGVSETRWVGTAEQAVAELDGLVRPGDCVLVKGSRAVALEVVADALGAVS